jgi:hypothetical protein
MDPKLNYDDPKYRTFFGVNNVGFQMENAGLVHNFSQSFFHSFFPK